MVIEFIDAQLLQDKFIKELALQVYEDQLNENMQSEFESTERKLQTPVFPVRIFTSCSISTVLLIFIYPSSPKRLTVIYREALCMSATGATRSTI